jgi:hypothetical protein
MASWCRYVAISKRHSRYECRMRGRDSQPAVDKPTNRCEPGHTCSREPVTHGNNWRSGFYRRTVLVCVGVSLVLLSYLEACSSKKLISSFLRRGRKTSIHWIVPTLAGIPIGFGFITIFLSLLNYTVDTYLTVSASAIAANTFLRSLFAAAFPLFTTQMFARLGVNWAGSLLALISLAMVPVPIIFYTFGSRIRQQSRWAPGKKK